MIRKIALLLLALVSAMFLEPARAARVSPPLVASPSHQIVVVTVNAFMTEGKPNIDARARELAEALRSRATSSDGNVYAPDAIIVQEIGGAQLAILRDDLNAVFSDGSGAEPSALPHFAIYGDADLAKAAFLINVETTDLSRGSARLWADDCENDRLYQVVENLRESASGAIFTVAGLHLATDYRDYLLPRDCGARNVERVRAELANDPGAIILGGDFNRRATETQGECDPNETASQRPWWTSMTGSSRLDARTYVDAVRFWHRTNGLTLGNDWTQERAVRSTLCNGTYSYRRNRIDYIFVSADTVVQEAHADHPGWAGPTPGTINCPPEHPFCKYSDHRFVWARLSI
jgi:endonuclease/exonuclease/phosphatase family metal-dependent hydrolase